MAAIKKQKDDAGTPLIHVSSIYTTYIRIYILLEREAAKAKKQAEKIESSQAEMAKEMKKLKVEAKENKKVKVEVKEVKEVKRESRKKTSLSPEGDSSEITQGRSTWQFQGFPLVPIVLLLAPCYRIFLVPLVRCEATTGFGLFPGG